MNQIKGRTAPLQGIRLIGILAIVIGHAGGSFLGGGIWCSFFFVLSGFLYSKQIASLHDYCQYIFKKFLGIFPIYWFCLALYLALAFLRRCPEQYTLNWDFFAYVLLIQSWIPGLNAQAYMGTAWFISSLFFCYLLSPVVKRILENRYMLMSPLFLILLWRICGFDWYISPIFRLFEYALGMSLRVLIFDKEIKKEIFAGQGLLSIIALLGIVCFWPNNYYVVISAFILVISSIYLTSSSVTSLVLGNKFVLYIASAGIFIYLTHPGIAFHLVFFFVGHNIYAIIIGSIVVGLILMWMYHASEVVIKRILKCNQ